MIYNKWELLILGDGGAYYIKRTGTHCYILGVRLPDGKIVRTGDSEGYYNMRDAEQDARGYATA